MFARKSICFLAIGLTAVVFAGCGGSSTTKVTTEEQQMAQQPQRAFEPECYTLPKGDENFIYGKGTMKSVDRQMAVDQADLVAATQIAANLERWVKENRFLREDDFQKFVAIQDSLNAGAATERSYKNTRDAIVSKIIKGTEEHCNEVYMEGNQYRCFRVLKVGIGKANKALQNEITQNETLMRMYKDSKALEELEKQVADFESRKSKGK